jgi:hypothetical protein
MAGIGIVRRSYQFALLLIVAVAVMVAAGATSAHADPPPGNWTLSWSDDFSALGIDTSKWNPAWNGGADGNGTSDISGECPSPEMASQPGDGYLHLRVQATPITCKYFNPTTQKLETISRSARGGVVSSESKYHFSYGYVEWKVDVPGTTKSGYSCAAGGCIANWPSFWSRSVGGLTEIDVVDTLDEGKASWRYHRFYPAPHVEWGETPTTAIGQGGGVHTYAARWEPGVVTWYYDGQKVYELPWSQVTSEPHYLLASYLPTRAGAKWGPPLVPAEAKVDYVKVWQHPKPTVTTDAATEVTPSTAKLNGSVYPNGLPTRYYFQYGKTTSYENTIPASPGMDIGNGTSYIYTWNNISGLEPGTTYHFRDVAVNATGTSYGVDREFTATPPPDVAFIDGANESTISKGRISLSSPWQEVSFLGHSARVGTRPAALTINGVPYVFFVDSSNNNTLSYRVYNSTSKGWEQVFLNGHRVAAGSSPSAVVVNGTPHVLFVDADNNNTITDWTWYAGPGWQQNFYGGDPVAAGTSPTTTVEGGDLRTFFVNAKNNNTISTWVWNTEGRGQTNFGGDPVAAGSSPSAVRYNGDIRVFFANASKSKTVSCWVWNQSGIGMTHFNGPSVAANSSPSALRNKDDIRIYFSDASKNGSISAWVWNSSGIGVMPFYGDQVTAGSSPSAVLFDGNAYIYFSDANRSNKLSVWAWGSSIQQILLNSHSLTAGTTPGATGSY